MYCIRDKGEHTLTTIEIECFFIKVYEENLQQLLKNYLK